MSSLWSPAHRVVQSVDLEDDSFGSFVTGAHKELSFSATADGLLCRRRVKATGRL